MFFIQGLTPQRCDYKYPENLTKTNDHEVLLGNFRSNKACLDPVVANLAEEMDAAVENGNSPAPNEVESSLI